MKPIILNINEISDSKEVYESKPNIFLTLFIYLVLGMLMFALIWMYVGHIDVVVKSEGMIRPNNQVGTIVNTYAGTLEAVYVNDGDYVKEGDLLYVIEHKSILTELDYYDNLLKDTEDTIALLNKYKKSIEDGVNYFKNNVQEEEYYLKFEGYLINYELAKNDSTFSNKERELNLKSIIKDLESINDKLIQTEKLKETINKHKNAFTNSGSEREYYNLFLKYISDYNAILKQYDNVKVEIDNSTTEAGLINSLDYYSSMLQGLMLLNSSINEGKSLFTSTDSYSLQYQECISKVEELTTGYEQAKENYEINKALEGLAVSEWEVEQSKIAMEDAKRAIETYKDSFLGNITSKITEVEKNLKDIKLRKDNTISKKELYKQNNKDKNAAIENYKLKYMVELDTTINSLKNNIKTLEMNKSNLELQEETTYYVKEQDGQLGSLVEYRNNELRTTLNTIDTYNKKKEELEANISKLNLQIENANVKATKSGVVNNNLDLVEGDTLASGTEVLTIIPDSDSKFKVNIYVSNTDIGKLKEGMNVKFNIYALPNNEYGYLTGKVTKISNDLKVDNNNSSGYYLVEASVDNASMYNAKGQEEELKIGMACQAQLITENKRILKFVLEKIDLWMD
jgi:membrane fusion protein, peptide pheromone/bacteriocin exporter